MALAVARVAGLEIASPTPTSGALIVNAVLSTPAGLNRWSLGLYGAESGSNAGSDIGFARYDDAGAWIETFLTIDRSTGGVQLLPTIPAADGYSCVVLGAAGAQRNIMLVGQQGYTNGFTVQYDGSKMAYNFYGGDATFHEDVGIVGGLSLGSNLAMPNNTAIIMRNAANTANVNVLYVDASDRTVLSLNTGLLMFADPVVSTTVGAAGGAAALPATPLGYLTCGIGATTIKIPYYQS